METETKKETAEYKDVESQIIDSSEGEFRIPEGADIDVSVSETPDKKLHITETVTVDEHEYLECEKRWVFLLKSPSPHERRQAIRPQGAAHAKDCYAPRPGRHTPSGL